MGEIVGDKLRGHVESLILAALENSEAHGLEIVKRIELAGSGALRLREGSVYPALYRMEEAGLIKARWEEKNSGRRGARRRHYQLTLSGKRRLAAARSEWADFVTIMNQALGAPS